MSDDDINCREYLENDYVSLKNGGEGRIVKILYIIMDNEKEVLFLKKCDLGNHTQKDIWLLNHYGNAFKTGFLFISNHFWSSVTNSRLLLTAILVNESVFICLFITILFLTQKEL